MSSSSVRNADKRALQLSVQHPNPVRLAVADVHRSGCAHENPVRTREAAILRRSVRTVAALPRADNGRDHAGPEIDAADGVALGVGEIETPVGRPGDPLRPRELRRLRGSSVARIARLAGSRDVPDAPGARVDPVHRVALSQHDVYL